MGDFGHGPEPGLGNLLTEAIGREAEDMDSLSTLGLCQRFQQEESRVPDAIAPCLDTVASLIDDMTPRLRAGGRLIYVGAGNSGRIAQMDCAELPVTFSVDPCQFVAVIAGGPRAVGEAVEGAEDARRDGEAAMDALRLAPHDIVIGISASGRTPFVLGAMQRAVSRGGSGGVLTAALTNAQPSAVGRLGVDYCITALVGPEFVAGSTRLKAGSCAKQLLTMISTCCMVRLGKTYRGLMVDVRVDNEKLRVRGRRIVSQVCRGKDLQKNAAALLRLDQETALDDLIDALIVRCGGSVKLACAVGASGLDLSDAKRRLQDVHGCLSDFISSLERGCPLTVVSVSPEKTPRLFLAIDGGGTKCAVSISTAQGVVAKAVTGPCNLHSASLTGVVEEIRTAVLKAVASLPPESPHRRASMPNFCRVWAGIAGFHHLGPPQTDKFARALERLFGVSAKDGSSLRLTCDTSLLSCCLAEEAEEDGEAGIALVAGTGSVAIAFRKTASGEVVQGGRAGGWGHLVGDDGSAFAIGKRALQSVLRRREGQDNGAVAGTMCETAAAAAAAAAARACASPSALEADVVRHLRCSDAADLLSTVLSTAGGSVPRLVMGSLARVVTRAAFPPSSSPAVDEDEGARTEAAEILHEAAGHLVSLVARLVRLGEASRTVLILSGALMGVEGYRELVLQKCREQGLCFRKIKVITDVSGYVASHLANLPLNEPATDLSTTQ
ncbi:hypothetical protein V2A60_004315 [Cordyceps javanica]